MPPETHVKRQLKSLSAPPINFSVLHRWVGIPVNPRRYFLLIRVVPEQCLNPAMFAVPDGEKQGL
jgi:hypothetical protein